MLEAIAAIIVALISYFASKKSGASTAQAAGVAALAGGGTYYVATRTDWGKSLISSVDTIWKPGVDKNGNPVLDENGQPVYAPDGAVVNVDEDGKPIVAADGSWWDTTIKSVADVLKEWGGTGTATVIGAGAVASDSNLRKWIPWIAGGALLLLLVK